jgi:hypothetical protein
MQVADKYIKGKIYSKNQLAEMFQFDNAFNFTKCYKRYFRSLPTFDNSPIFNSNDEKVRANGAKNQTHNWEKYAQKLRIGTWIRDYETLLINWDVNLKAILELSPDFEPDINPALNFYKEGFDRDLAKRYLDEAFYTGSSFDFNARIITAKGNEKIVRVLGFTQFENNTCKKMFGVIQEITIPDLSNFGMQ